MMAKKKTKQKGKKSKGKGIDLRSVARSDQKVLLGNIKFNISPKESIMFDKYGTSIKEYAQSGDYFFAIKLLDKILKELPESEPALVMKAQFMYEENKNSITSLGELTLDNAKKMHKKLQKSTKDFEKSIALLDKVLKINHTSKPAKVLKKHITESGLKPTIAAIKSIELNILAPKQSKNIQKQATKKQNLRFRTSCPYCKHQQTQPIHKSENDIVCKKCNKEYHVTFGIVSGLRGVGGGWMAKNVTIRYKKIEGGEGVINYYGTRQTPQLKHGDPFLIIYTKGLLSSKYNIIYGIVNYNTKEYAIMKIRYHSRVE